jgi:hypothetical protein
LIARRLLASRGQRVDDGALDHALKGSASVLDTPSPITSVFSSLSMDLFPRGRFLATVAADKLAVWAFD